MSSLSNSFFDDLVFTSNERTIDIDKLIIHGLQTKSQMVVSFKERGLSEFNLISDHYYALLHLNSKNDLIVLYNPHGKVLSLSKKDFNEIEPKLFEICYSDDKIFGIPVIKTNLNLASKWPTLKCNERIHFVDYHLLVTKDETEILINVNVKNLSVEIKPTIFIITNNEEITLIKSSQSVFFVNRKRNHLLRRSLRKKLKRGIYKIVVVISKWNKLESCEGCRKYLENGGDEFLFRIATSKHCVVEKCTIKETSKIEKVLFDWHDRLYSRKNYHEENCCNILYYISILCLVIIILYLLTAFIWF